MSLSDALIAQHDRSIELLDAWRQEIDHLLTVTSVTPSDLDRLERIREQTLEVLVIYRHWQAALQQLSRTSDPLISQQKNLGIVSLGSALPKVHERIQNELKAKQRRLRDIGQTEIQRKLEITGLERANEILAICQQISSQTPQDAVRLMVLATHPSLQSVFDRFAGQFVKSVTVADDMALQQIQTFISQAPDLFFLYTFRFFNLSPHVADALRTTGIPYLNTHAQNHLRFLRFERPHAIETFISVCYILRDYGAYKT